MTRTRSSAPTRALYVAEPSPAWAERPPAVVDCSALAAILWGEPAAEQAAARLAGHSLHAPSLLAYELANVARNKVRAGVPADVARAGLETFAKQKIVLAELDAPRLFDVAQRLSLTAYDAAYVCLAADLRAPLITFDQRLAEAARQHLGGPGDTP